MSILNSSKQESVDWGLKNTPSGYRSEQFISEEDVPVEGFGFTEKTSAATRRRRRGLQFVPSSTCGADYRGEKVTNLDKKCVHLWWWQREWRRWGGRRKSIWFFLENSTGKKRDGHLVNLEEMHGHQFLQNISKGEDGCRRSPSVSSSFPWCDEGWWLFTFLHLFHVRVSGGEIESQGEKRRRWAVWAIKANHQGLEDLCR